MPAEHNKAISLLGADRRSATKRGTRCLDRQATQLPVGYNPIMFGIRSHKCPTCQAPLTIAPEAEHTSCGYCGNQVILKSRAKRKKTVVAQPSSPYIPPTPKVNRWPMIVVVLGLPLLGMGFFVFQSRTTLPTTKATTPHRSQTVEPSDRRSVARLEPEAAVVEAPVTPKLKRKSRKSSKSRRKRPSKKTPTETKAVGDVAGTGELSKTAARRILSGVHMLHCSASGDVRVRVSIAPNGRVSQATPKSQDEVARCVSDTVKELRFSSSASGLETSHRYRW